MLFSVYCYFACNIFYLSVDEDVEIFTNKRFLLSLKFFDLFLYKYKVKNQDKSHKFFLTCFWN